MAKYRNVSERSDLFWDIHDSVTEGVRLENLDRGKLNRAVQVVESLYAKGLNSEARQVEEMLKSLVGYGHFVSEDLLKRHNRDWIKSTEGVAKDEF